MFSKSFFKYILYTLNEPFFLSFIQKYRANVYLNIHNLLCDLIAIEEYINIMKCVRPNQRFPNYSITRFYRIKHNFISVNCWWITWNHAFIRIIGQLVWNRILIYYEYSIYIYMEIRSNILRLLYKNLVRNLGPVSLFSFIIHAFHSLSNIVHCN